MDLQQREGPATAASPRVVNSQIGTGSVNNAEDLSPELKEFIDQLIVPLLVQRMMAETGHLYGAQPSRYDDVEPLAPAAQEAA
jgi:hypothetical protein